MKRMFSPKCFAMCFATLTASLVLSVAAVTTVSREAAAGPLTNPNAGNPATRPATRPIFNKICPVNKEPVDPDTKTVDYKGKRIGFCCSSCIADFKKDPEKYMKDLK